MVTYEMVPSTLHQCLKYVREGKQRRIAGDLKPFGTHEIRHKDAQYFLSREEVAFKNVASDKIATLEKTGSPSSQVAGTSSQKNKGGITPPVETNTRKTSPPDYTKVPPTRSLATTSLNQQVALAKSIPPVYGLSTDEEVSDTDTASSDDKVPNEKELRHQNDYEYDTDSESSLVIEKVPERHYREICPREVG
jgi:hypothetical protein